MPAALPLDADRLWSDIMALAAITDADHPYTRRSFTPLFLKGRAWLSERFAEAGLATRIDAAGNLIGRIEGDDPALGVIAVGSHSDTVPSGGRFDGIAGVAAGLEVARALRERADAARPHPGSHRFSCRRAERIWLILHRQPRHGRCARGAMLDLTEPHGETLRGGVAPGRRRSGSPAVSEGATTSRRFWNCTSSRASCSNRNRLTLVSLRRSPASAASRSCSRAPPITPVPRRCRLRHDALVAAANTVVSVRRIAEQLAAAGSDYFVATVGILNVAPGARNVVPGRCRLVIDARTTDPALTRKFVERSSTRASAMRKQRTSRERRSLTLSDGPPVGVRHQRCAPCCARAPGDSSSGN